jgi:hypothetical protein
MAAPRGNCNNPNGRPPKSRSLTEALNRAMKKSVIVDGKRVGGKLVVANLVAHALKTGRLHFPEDTEESVLSVKDWIEFVKWAYQYLEPPIQPHEITGAEGGPINIVIDK